MSLTRKNKSKDKGTYLKPGRSQSKLPSYSAYKSQEGICSKLLRQCDSLPVKEGFNNTGNNQKKQGKLIHQIDDYGFQAEAISHNNQKKNATTKTPRKLQLKLIKPSRSSKHIKSPSKQATDRQSVKQKEHSPAKISNNLEGLKNKKIPMNPVNRQHLGIKKRAQSVQRQDHSVNKTITTVTKQSSADQYSQKSFASCSLNIQSKLQQEPKNRNSKPKDNLSVLQEIPIFSRLAQRSIVKNLRVDNFQNNENVQRKIGKSRKQDKESLEASCRTSILDTSDKILMYQDVLNCLAEYSLQLRKMYQDYAEWEELVFLVYKRFYIERMQFISGITDCLPEKFKIDFIQFSKPQLEQFRKNSCYRRIVKDAQTKNGKIKNQLLMLYEKISDKQSKPHITLRKADKQSKMIWEDMWEQIEILSEQMNEDSKVIQSRICKVLQTAFLISELDGEKLIGYLEGVEVTDFTDYFIKCSLLFQQHLLA